MLPIDVKVTWPKVKVKLLVFIPSAVYSIFDDPLISIDFYCYYKKVKLRIKVKLSTELISTATNRNAASQKIVAYFAIKPIASR